MKSLLFVCTGNICRSPCLEAIMKALVKAKGLDKEIFVDSCGTSSYHIGCKANIHMSRVAKQQGVEIDHIAKLFDPVFLDVFDYIFAVDYEVREYLISHSTKENIHKIHLATAYSKKYPSEEIPDPYYGGDRGFILSFEMAEDCCQSILDKIQKS